MTSAKASSDKSIVFGRARWMENSQKRQMSQSLMGWHIEPRRERLEDGTRIHGKVDLGGRLRWRLPTGKYIIDRKH